MAVRMRKNKRPGRGGRIALAVFAALLALLLATIGLAALNANALRVRRARVSLPDLPPSFEGKTLLYASDIDLCGLNTPRKSAALFQRLQALAPDILVLGGDYASDSLFDVLNRSENGAATAEKCARARTDFFHYISGFSAPLGKYAIAAPEDGDPQALSALLSECDFTPLIDSRAAVTLGGDTLWLCGVCGDAAPGDVTALRRGDCAVAVAWGPAAFPAILTGEAGDGGPWADLLLAGHTHGGQIRLFGRGVLPQTQIERRYAMGWHAENGVPVLLTSGVGCEGANLRLGTRPEVWLITLTAGE